MSNEELRKYVYEQHIAGVQDTEIARHLGLTVEELAEKLEGKSKKMNDAKNMQTEGNPEKPEKPQKPEKQPKVAKESDGFESGEF